MRSRAQSTTSQRSISPQCCVLLQAQYQFRAWACTAQNNVERRDSLHDVTVLVRHSCRTAAFNPGVRGPQDSCRMGREPFFPHPCAPLFQDDIDFNLEVRILRIHRCSKLAEHQSSAIDRCLKRASEMLQSSLPSCSVSQSRLGLYQVPDCQQCKNRKHMYACLKY